MLLILLLMSWLEILHTSHMAAISTRLACRSHLQPASMLATGLYCKLTCWGRGCRRQDKYAAQPLHPPLAAAETEGPRAISRAVEKNRGLTPHRPKDIKNPRVKVTLPDLRCPVGTTVGRCHGFFHWHDWVPIAEFLMLCCRARRGLRRPQSADEARCRMCASLQGATGARSLASSGASPRARAFHERVVPCWASLHVGKFCVVLRVVWVHLGYTWLGHDEELFGHLDGHSVLMTHMVLQLQDKRRIYAAALWLPMLTGSYQELQDTRAQQSQMKWGLCSCYV